MKNPTDVINIGIESKEKTTQQLNQDNAWLEFLNTGKRPSRSLPVVTKPKTVLTSSKQRRAILWRN